MLCYKRQTRHTKNISQKEWNNDCPHQQKKNPADFYLNNSADYCFRRSVKGQQFGWGRKELKRRLRIGRGKCARDRERERKSRWFLMTLLIMFPRFHDIPMVFLMSLPLIAEAMMAEANFYFDILSGVLKHIFGEQRRPFMIITVISQTTPFNESLHFSF